MKGKLQGIITCNWLKRCVFNSAYGALGNKYFRFFDVRQATAVTTAGQLSIRWIGNALNSYLNRLLGTEKDYVLASDTDSVYLCLDGIISQTIGDKNPIDETISFMDIICEKKIQPFIDRSFNSLAEYVNAAQQKMIMKREVLADKGIWTAKKRYILNVYNSEGVAYKEPEIKISGLEVKKSSTPSFFREKLEKCIEIIINGNEDKLISYIDECKKEMKEQNIADIAFPRGVNGLKKFYDAKTIYGKGTPIHVRGSLLYNELLYANSLHNKYNSIKEGEKIKFIYLKEPNKIKSNIISFPDLLPEELDLHKLVDYDTQFEKAFIEPLKIITDVIGWKTEKVVSLLSFFE